MYVSPGVWSGLYWVVRPIFLCCFLALFQFGRVPAGILVLATLEFVTSSAMQNRIYIYIYILKVLIINRFLATFPRNQFILNKKMGLGGLSG